MRKSAKGNVQDTFRLFLLSTTESKTQINIPPEMMSRYGNLVRGRRYKGRLVERCEFEDYKQEKLRRLGEEKQPLFNGMTGIREQTELFPRTSLLSWMDEVEAILYFAPPTVDAANELAAMYAFAWELLSSDPQLDSSWDTVRASTPGLMIRSGRSSILSYLRRLSDSFSTSVDERSAAARSGNSGQQQAVESWIEAAFFEHAARESPHDSEGLRLLIRDGRWQGEPLRLTWDVAGSCPRFSLHPATKDEQALVSGWSTGEIGVPVLTLCQKLGRREYVVERLLAAVNKQSNTVKVDDFRFKARLLDNPVVRHCLRMMLSAIAKDSAALQSCTGPSIRPPSCGETTVGRETIGIEYVPADERHTTPDIDPFQIDPAKVDRGNRGHAQTQNAMADFLRSEGLSPRSPSPSEPDYDLGWEQDGQRFVAEVKSLTSANEEKQLRLGLGQVLRYRTPMPVAKAGQQVVAVLVAERKPSDLPSWEQTCREVGVLLVWPGAFDPLVLGHGRLVLVGVHPSGESRAILVSCTRLEEMCILLSLDDERIHLVGG